jgi:hypothetical protein
MPRRARPLVPLLLASLALGCVSAARDDVAAARERYARCVAAVGEAKCVAERERVLAAERAYEENAQRAWGCSPAQPDCPPTRE